MSVFAPFLKISVIIPYRRENPIRRPGAGREFLTAARVLFRRRDPSSRRKDPSRGPQNLHSVRRGGRTDLSPTVRCLAHQQNRGSDAFRPTAISIRPSIMGVAEIRRDGRSLSRIPHYGERNITIPPTHT